VSRVVEPDATILGLALAEQAAEGEELETAFSVGVAFLMQPTRERPIEVGVD
jgi:hypothetical protein